MAKLTTGNLVRQAREQMGMTRMQLATATGLSISTIDRIELANKLPSAANLARIARTLNMSLDAMLFVDQAAS